MIAPPQCPENKKFMDEFVIAFRAGEDTANICKEWQNHQNDCPQCRKIDEYYRVIIQNGLNKNVQK